MGRLHTLWRDRRGSSAVEFALVFPGFIVLTLGALYLSLVLYALTSAHQATEAAARYASIQQTLKNAPTQTSIAAYATGLYKGPGVSPAFTYTHVATATSSNCGNKVTASGTFRLITGLSFLTVPIRAAACFP